MEKNKALLKQMLKSATSLSIYILIGVGSLILTYQLTKDDIAKAEREFMIATINELLPADAYDNDLLQDQKQISNSALGTSEPVTLYRARKAGKPVAIITETIAPDGYSGNIYMLMAVYTDGRIAGVRVLKHKETPGLGDKIEVKKSSWILEFNGRSLREDNFNKWGVKKDGGMFDQFTGATITPRAVVKAIRKTLSFVKEQGDTLYE